MTNPTFIKTKSLHPGSMAFLSRHAISSVTVAGIVLSLLYWCVVASDRYISESHVIIQNTDLSSGQSVDLTSLISGSGTPANTDQLLLRDHLLSVDMLKKLDQQLDLRGHYSDRRHDLLSRMWAKDLSLEKFHAYYLSRVSVEYDSFAGVLVIRSQAFDPKTAYAITRMLVDAGEAFMNQLAHRLAQEQVDFLADQIEIIRKDTMKSRQELLDFQNKHNLVSPQVATENVASIVNNLEAQLTDLETRRSAMIGYLMPNTPNIAELDLQIKAVQQQIVREKARLTSQQGKTLNRTLEAYQRLEMVAQFNQDLYKTALIALQKGRFEAARTLKKMSVLQLPTSPEYPLEPRRVYNSLVSVLVILLAAGIFHLVAAIVRDHKD